MFSRLLAAMAVLVMSSAIASADFVSPRIGGGQVMHGTAPMIHADILLTGNALSVVLDTSHGTPLLRPLEPPNQFNPLEPWNVLIHKAYNFQYAWNPGPGLELPADGWIWIEQTAITPGLEIYQRAPASPAWAPIFGTADSPDTWMWPGSMTHNCYAVSNPDLTSYSASYRIFMADINGNELMTGLSPTYQSTSITLTWNATRTGDANRDGSVDDDDLSLLLANWGTQTDWSHGEFSESWPVDDDDLSLLLSHWTGSAGTIPEPATIALLLAGALGLARRR